MIDNLINLIRQHAGDAVLNNPSVPSDKNENAVSAAGSSIMGTLQSALAGGRLNEVLGYFKNGGSGSENIIRDATGNYASELRSNLGLGDSEANSIAEKVVPGTMRDLAARATDPSDNGFDIQDIFNQLSGGKTGGLNIAALLSKFGGGKLDADGDGDVDFQDLQKMFMGGGSGGGGVLDSIKGMFK